MIEKRNLYSYGEYLKSQHFVILEDCASAMFSPTLSRAGPWWWDWNREFVNTQLPSEKKSNLNINYILNKIL
jgi:hypothetical protein